MELDGAKRCFNFLTQAGLKIPVFISDRHTSIAKWLREQRKDTLHLYDLWHVCKSLCKQILKASKEKGCECLKDWMSSIKKHLYWCALSTKQGFGALILAKWKSLLRHISGKHKDHPDPLFPKCGHAEYEVRRQWVKFGKFFIIIIRTSWIHVVVINRITGSGRKFLCKITQTLKSTKN